MGGEGHDDGRRAQVFDFQVFAMTHRALFYLLGGWRRHARSLKRGALYPRGPDGRNKTRAQKNRPLRTGFLCCCLSRQKHPDARLKLIGAGEGNRTVIGQEIPKLCMCVGARPRQIL
jgi:hypothetical protein